MNPAARLLRASLALAATLWSVGCLYTVPVTEEHSLPVDPAVLGLWEEVPEGEGRAEAPPRMLVLPFSQTEYLVEYPLGPEAFYFRAWPVKVAGQTMVQLQVIRDNEGRLTTPKPYHVVAYRTRDGMLDVRTLNDDLVGRKFASTQELVAAIEAHREDPELFREPGRFRRVAGE